MNDYTPLDEIEGIDSATLSIMTSTLDENELTELEEDLDGDELRDLRRSIRRNLSIKKRNQLAQRLDSSLVKKLRISPEDLMEQAEKDSIKRAEKELAKKQADDSIPEEDGFFDIFEKIDQDVINKYKDNPRVSDEQVYDSLNLGDASDFQRYLILQSIKVRRGNQSALAQLALENLPLMMLALIPIFGLVLKLLYIRRRQLYIKHVIHALHLHSFAYFIYGLCLLSSTYFISDEDVGDILLFISFFGVSTYAYISFLRVYKQHWFKTLIKFNAVGFIYLFFVFCFFIFEILISFALF